MGNGGRVLEERQVALLDQTSPGELWGVDTPHLPTQCSSGSSDLPCRMLLRWPSKQRWRERGRGEEVSIEKGADRNISGYELVAVCFPGSKPRLVPLERCAASGLSFPAAGAPSGEHTEAKNMISKAPDVSGNKLQRRETHHTATRDPELKIPGLNELCSFSANQ